MTLPAGKRFSAAASLRVSLLAALLLAFDAGTLPAHTDARFYRGDISVSTSWEGVIRLTGTVVIREGITVTVAPGTEVLVQTGVGADIVVKGRLLVRGAPGRPVLFDAAGGCLSDPWGAIVFTPGSAGTLEHARIRCSSGGIRGDLSAVERTGVIVESLR